MNKLLNFSLGLSRSIKSTCPHTLSSFKSFHKKYKVMSDSSSGFRGSNKLRSDDFLKYTRLYSTKNFCNKNDKDDKDEKKNNENENSDAEGDKYFSNTELEKELPKNKDGQQITYYEFKNKIKEREQAYKDRNKATVTQQEDQESTLNSKQESQENNQSSSSNEAGEVKQDSEDPKSKIDFHPLIFFSHPILPHSTITIYNPNRNDVFLGLALKYGKLTAIDEETTEIEDITVFFEKEDPLKKKEITSYILGTVCKLSYNKQRLVIEGTDKLNRIKSVRQGKYKSYKAKDAVELSVDFVIEDSYANDCKNLLKDVLKIHDLIVSEIEFKNDQFSDMDVKFSFGLDEIKSVSERPIIGIGESNSSSATATSQMIIDLENDSKKDSTQTSEEKPNLPINTDNFLEEASKHSYYFALKLNTFVHSVYGLNNDFIKLLNITDLRERYEKILENYTNIYNLLKMKYDEYNFPKNFKLNFNNPFINETEEDKLRILKYKESIDHKMKDLDNIEKLKEEFRTKLHKIHNMSSEVQGVIEKEIQRISPVSLESENSKRIEYLNHIFSLPWDTFDEQRWDIKYAKSVLDSKLYGLTTTKDRIYEFIAKNLRNKHSKGCVVLLTGGPGTGKTRIAKLIGEALQRKVGFISLAGVSDGKTILGFKRTYVSSTPGVLIREMQKLNVKNPVIVIDEIDKVNFRFSHSNIYHALLQLLNPEENTRFTDHYLEIPFDFSNVIFILTSNSEEIFEPLKDRMEIIKVDPYVSSEKFLIVKNFAKKEVLNEYNYDGDQLEITDKALYRLVNEHCRHEAGVRKMKKLIDLVVRRVNAKLQLDKDNNENVLKEKKLQVNSKNILKIINIPSEIDPVLTDVIQNGSDNSGFCIGLFVSKTDQSNSWGDASIFSVALKNNKAIGSLNLDQKDRKSSKEKNGKKSMKKFKYTSSGNLGEDSLQSLDISLHLASKLLLEIDPIKYNEFFYQNEVHYDCPHILQPKSGPSAGVVAFLCAMSAALEKPVIPNLALTGEVCIDGSVLKIGGVKEKSQGAMRYGVKTLVLPIGNKHDFLELPNNLKGYFDKVFFVENVTQVYNIGFGKDTTGIDCYESENIHIEMEETVPETIQENNYLNKYF